MRFCLLASGSRANCTFLEAGGTRVLIDCGLSASQAEARLRLMGIDPRSIDAIFVTHEHRDHIHGVGVWSRRYPCKVFASKRTTKELVGVRGLNEFIVGEALEFGSLQILPFPISHDAAEPVGFSLEHNGEKFCQVTDLGCVTSPVRAALRGAHALVVEANHDEALLRACSYPADLKQRILSAHGHLSNDTCGQFLSTLVHSDLEHVILGHLSENSNTPQLARECVARYLPHRLAQRLTCASRYEAGPIFEIGREDVQLLSAG